MLIADHTVQYNHLITIILKKNWLSKAESSSCLRGTHNINIYLSKIYAGKCELVYTENMKICTKFATIYSTAMRTLCYVNIHPLYIKYSSAMDRKAYVNIHCTIMFESTMPQQQQTAINRNNTS